MTRSLYSPRNKKLSQMLKEERKKAGIIQKDLAEILGETHTFVTKYENCERRLDVDEIERILKALKVNAKDFFSRLYNWK
ncbi:MAG: helix-turn-helix domain-containing protein [Lactobacillus sp.]|jgi:transcriptional regulator with XRE-family HTH domain|nr:helix-turn-helix domain-containing protein [Lactobacillus sp.]